MIGYNIVHYDFYARKNIHDCQTTLRIKISRMSDVLTDAAFTRKYKAVLISTEVISGFIRRVYVTSVLANPFVTETYRKLTTPISVPTQQSLKATYSRITTVSSESDCLLFLLDKRSPFLK